MLPFGCLGHSLTIPKAAVTPVEKVNQMMQELMQKAQEELNQEQINYSRFKQWCTDTEAAKVTAIQEAQDTIDSSASTIEQMDINIRDLSDQINVHNNDNDVWAKNQKAITDIRGKENRDFLATQADYEESLSALDQATALLRSKVVKIKQEDSAGVASSLIQIVNSKIMLKHKYERGALEAFLQGTSTAPLDNEDKAYAYESSVGSIVHILEGLSSKFTKEKRDMEKEELNSKHAYEAMMQEMNDQTNRSKQAVERKTQERADDMKTMGDAKVAKADAETRLENDSKYKEELVGMCGVRAQEFPARQELRKSEIAGIQECLNILKKYNVRGAEKANLRATSFAQMGSIRAMNPLTEKAVEVLTRDAQRLGSNRLSMLAEQMSKGPFDQVIKLVKNLIVALRDEATKEGAQSDSDVNYLF